jgi:hypothetical protein
MFKPLKHPNVRILSAAQEQLVGKTGVIFGREGKLHQVRLDQPVEISGIGVVETNLFETSALRIIRPPVAKPAIKASPVVARDPVDGEAKPVDVVIVDEASIITAEPGPLSAAEPAKLCPAAEPSVSVPETVIEPRPAAAARQPAKRKGTKGKTAQATMKPKGRKVKVVRAAR